MSNNDSQRPIDNSNTQQRRQRRKFHSPLCDCVFCMDFYETKIRQTSPDWQCFCQECATISYEEMDEEMNEEMNEALHTADVRQYLRRTNNCFCRCGVCANCVNDTEFFYTVYWHKKTRIECKCPFCELYDYNVLTFNP
jgi:hypothetical protein